MLGASEMLFCPIVYLFDVVDNIFHLGFLPLWIIITLTSIQHAVATLTHADVVQSLWQAWYVVITRASVRHVTMFGVFLIQIVQELDAFRHVWCCGIMIQQLERAAQHEADWCC